MPMCRCANVEELLDRTSDSLAICRLVGSALDRMLTINEGEILIAVLVGVRKGDLDIFAFEVDNRIQRTTATSQ